MDKDIRQFMEVTGSSYQIAKQFLQMAGNDVNQAVLLYFDQQDSYTQPQQQPQPKPQPQKKPEQKPQVTTEKGSNFHQFKPNNTAREEMVNGGENVALYRPQKQDNQQIELILYQNGFMFNNNFYDYEKQTNVEYKDQMLKNGDIPQQLLQDNGIYTTSDKIQVNSIDRSQIKYTKNEEQNENKQEKYDFQGQGKLIEGTFTPFKNSGEIVQIKLQKSNAQIKIKADKTYIIQCNLTNRIGDILKFLSQKGHLNQIQLSRLQAQTGSGQIINLNKSVSEEHIQGKVISLFYIK